MSNTVFRVSFLIFVAICIIGLLAGCADNEADYKAAFAEKVFRECKGDAYIEAATGAWNYGVRAECREIRK